MKEKAIWPRVSIIILTLNGVERIKRSLPAVTKQDYPKNRLEIIIVDGGSTDGTIEVARKLGAKVYINPKSDVYRSWSIALHKITGDFTYMIDDDIILRSKDFVKQMVKPLLEDEKIMASFTREGYPNPNQSWITRFISYHPAQCDPLYEFIAPSVESTFLEKKTDYVLCRFVLGNVPPFGRMFYRVSYLKKTPSWKSDRVYDQDMVIKSIKSGYSLFSYVQNALIDHNHAASLRHLLKKRTRNLHTHYFPENQSTEYRWLDVNDKRAVLRLCLWVIYANLIFPATIRGVIRAIKHRDWVLLTEPLITITTTDVILWNFLTSGVGRGILTNSLKSLLNISSQKTKGAFGK